MLKSPKGKFARALVAESAGKGKGIPAKLVQPARRKLAMLNSATSLEDLATPPANNLKKLSGDREGQYSFRINAQWRICFRWDGRDVRDYEIVDYH